MKPVSQFWLVGLVAFVLGVGSPVRGWADAAPKPATAAASDDLGYDYFNGKTNKIGRVYNVTPVSVQVIYVGDRGGRNIPRTDLPPELKAKYPFDPDAAAEFIKNRTAEVTARNTAQRKAWEEKVVELKGSLELLKKSINDNEHAIHSLTLQIRADKHNKDMRDQKAELLVQQDGFLKRRAVLQAKLMEAQKMVDTLL